MNNDEETRKYRLIMMQVLIRNYSNLSSLLWRHSLMDFATDMYSRGLISESSYRDPSFQKIMSEFESGMNFQRSVSKLEQYFQSFLESLSNQGGPVEHIAKALEQEWKEEVYRQFGASLNWSVDDYKIQYEKAKEEGYVTVKWAKFSLSGPPGTGKSSFLKLLFDEPPPVYHDSTPVVQAHKAKITAAITKEEGSLWKEIDSMSLRVMIAEQWY